MFLDLLQQELGASKKSSGQTRFCCPFCMESKFRFYVGDSNFLWICFKCEEKGNPLAFAMKYYSMTFEEAVDLLADYDYEVSSNSKNGKNSSSLNQYGDELTEEEKLLLFISREGRPLEDNTPVQLSLPSLPTNCKQLMANFNNPEAYPFFDYLKGRGVTLDHIKQHNISYVTHGTVLLADGRKLDLHNHVVFFTFDENGKPVYWNTRSIEKEPFIKSFNAPSKEGEHSKNTVVFNLNNARHQNKIVVHEGVFNSFMTPQSGVATFGKMITDEQIRLLLSSTSQYQTPIYLYLDTDAWDRMINAAHRIREIEPYRELYYVYNFDRATKDLDANDLGFSKVQYLVDNAIKADTFGDMTLRLDNM